MSQVELEDVGRTNWRTMPCPACGHPVTWTVATKAEEKVTCTNDVGERNQKRKCGFMMRRAEWDYVLTMGETWSAKKFVDGVLEAYYALSKNASRRR